ncbi:MAG: ubiquinol-cytochrome C reductase, partial [Candidatus Aquiluna sp.]|nr:ubiquinol-cytochrome C reductase [Aquiluna sp.]
MSEVQKYDSGSATNIERPISDPGIEPHRVRMTDKSEKHAKTAERQISFMFLVSIVGAIIAVWGFVAFPIVGGDLSATRNNAFWMGIGMALSLLGIGFGAVHWAKTLMPDNEISESRHPARSSDEARAKAIEIVKLADGESGFTRRKLIRRTLYGALAFFPIPAVVIFGDLGPQVGDTLKHTMWRAGTRLTKDPTGIPIKASEVTIGSVFHVIPEGLKDLEEHKLEEKAKAAVLLVRVNPGDLKEDPEKANWSYDGIVAYSKICTHVGCPVALYEQHT